MATFFGEVVFSSSRAFDDDDDDNALVNGKNETLTLDLLPLSSQALCDVSETTQHLLVILGPTANVFSDCYLLHQESENVGAMNKRLLGDSQPKEQAIVTRLKEHADVLVCKCTENVDEHLQFSFVEQLFSFIKNSNITVSILSSCSGSDYTTPRQDVSFPILRCLKTSSFTGEVAAPYLESPNTVSSLASATLSYCQIHHIPAVMYPVYVDSIFMDSDAVTAFSAILKVEPFRRIAKKSDNFADVIRAAIDKPSHLDSLYT